MTNMMALGVLTGVGMFLFILIVAFFFVVAIVMDAYEKRNRTGYYAPIGEEDDSCDDVEEAAEMLAYKRRGETILSKDKEDEQE